MQAFHLESRMLSFLGGFYPTGHCFVMFPTLEHAQHGEELLAKAGIDPAQVRLLMPQDVLDVAHHFEGRDLLLPSVGTEGDTARHFAELARQGHHALLVPARNGAACSKVMDALKDAGVSNAVHYGHLVIEDLA